MTYTIVSQVGVTWVDLIAPNARDMDRLKQEFPQFHPLALEDCLSALERPKIDEYDDHLFVVMQFPRWDGDVLVTHAAEVDLFIGEGYVATIHDGELAPLTQLTERFEQDDLNKRTIGETAMSVAHLIIDSIVDSLLPTIGKVDARIREIEREVFSADVRKVMQRISEVRRDLIVLRRIIGPQVGLVSSLERTKKPFMGEGLEDYFDDVLDHITKVRDALEEDRELIDGLADTVDTLASVRINEVMRTLTVISVIMLPLTLIAGLYGMNIPLPGAESPTTIYIILAVMLMISLAMLGYFRHRRWL